MEGKKDNVHRLYRNATNAKEYLRAQLAAALLDRAMLQDRLAQANSTIKTLEAELGYSKREISIMRKHLLPTGVK